jgi:hypothetical protein
LQLNSAGDAELKLKTPWYDETTHRVISSLKFMQRLATLVPRPRLLSRLDGGAESATRATAASH